MLSDLSTMQTKLDKSKYDRLSKFKNDFKLMISNCEKFNEFNVEFLQIGRRLDSYFDGVIKGVEGHLKKTGHEQFL